MLKLVDIRRVLVHQLHRQSERARGVDVIVAKYLIVNRTGLQHVGLKGDLNRNDLFVLHGSNPLSVYEVP